MRRRKFLQQLTAFGSCAASAPNFLKAQVTDGQPPASVEESALRPLALKCEYAENPLGVDAARPRLSWRVESPRRAKMQTAYQLLVATSAAKLAEGTADLWDSGRVASDRSIQIEYQGRALRSFDRCYWKVRVWDQSGALSPYSQTATWEMGLLAPTDWKAKWITADYLLRAESTVAQRPVGPGPHPRHRAPLFRKTFRLHALPLAARAYLCGLGYGELYLNGFKVGDHVLDPAQTDYEERALYVTYDVTQYLLPGENTVGVMLGSGWFNQDVVWKEGKYRVPGGTDYGVPRVLLQLRWEYRDGSVETLTTDETWKVTAGPVFDNNVYAGEVYDARLELAGWSGNGLDDQVWTAASLAASPTKRLEAQTLPPIKRTATLRAVTLSQPKPGNFVYDFGQNFAGWARLKVSAPRGTRIELRFAESVHSDGTIDPASTGVFATGVVQTDVYIAKGAGEEVWEPRFTYHGFRYVEVTGLQGAPSLENLEGVVVHSAVPRAGNFVCSDAALNQIHEMALRTETSNLHGVPTDCPARERCGWLGDAQVSAEMTILNFDMAAFWAKYVRDIRTSEQSGLPTMVAPGKRKLGEAVPDWGTATVQLPWYLYLYYGDTGMLAEHYNEMQRWVDHLRKIARDNVLNEGLGDWCPPGSVAPTETPVALTSTAYFYLDARMLSAAAKILDHKQDAADYGLLADNIREAFGRKFFESSAKSYGSQTADSLALRLGLVPAADEAQVASSLARDVTEKHGGHFSTGITGSRSLYWALGEYGHGDVALTIFRQNTYPSIGYLISLGATTFWETWGEPEIDQQHGPRSRNHPMQGGFDTWFYQGLGGICPDPERPAFKHVVLRPQVPPGLGHVRATYDSIYGRIRSEWWQEDQHFRWHIEVPANTRATVYMPCNASGAITEGARPVREVKEILWHGGTLGRAIFEIGSGEYHLAADLPVDRQVGEDEVPSRPWW